MFRVLLFYMNEDKEDTLDEIKHYSSLNNQRSGGQRKLC